MKTLRDYINLIESAEQGVAEGYSNTTFQTERRRLNVPELIKSGAIFVTYPHGEQGWELDNKEDWAYSLLSLYNVMQGGWPSEAKKYLKPASYKKAEQQINSSAPNLGSDKLVYDGKYNQILWSIKKLGIPENIAFLDIGQQGVAEGQDNTIYQVSRAMLDNNPGKSYLKASEDDILSDAARELSRMGMSDIRVRAIMRDPDFAGELIDTLRGPIKPV